MTPITVTRSLPLVANMAVMGQPAKHLAHILANPSIPSLDKVFDSIGQCAYLRNHEGSFLQMGLIKPGSIPIIGNPYLNAQAGGRPLIKPVVVVAAPQSTSPSAPVASGREGSSSSGKQASRPPSP